MNKEKAKIVEELGLEDYFIDDPEELFTDFISTGVLAVDRATSPHRGTGGIPLGKITEIFGAEDSGKTSLCMSTIAQAQKKGLDVTYFDPEESYNPFFAELMGVDNNKVDFCPFDQLERVVDAIEAFAINEVTDLIIVDSIPGLSSEAILKTKMSDDNVAPDARKWAKAYKKLKGALSRSNVGLILVNQTRDDVGNMYGRGITTSGGRARKFWVDIRMELRPKKPYYVGNNENKKKIGHQIEVVIIKNKIGTNGKRARFDIYYDSGIDYDKDIVNVATDLGVINKSGSWYSYTYKEENTEDKENDEEEKEVEEIELQEQGKDNFLNMIHEHEKEEEILEQIREEIHEIIERN